MTYKMLEWNVDKIDKLQDLTIEMLEGVNDALDYISSKRDMPIDHDELEMIYTIVTLCNENLKVSKKWQELALKMISKVENKSDSVME